jgi:hypothetical protein
MPALSAVPVGGDADLTELPCPRSPCSILFLVRRRSPSAASSLLRKPSVRPSWTCGASSGRRVMAPASLHNNHEAANGNSERWRTTQARADPRRGRLVTGRYPVATPTTARQQPRQHRRSPGATLACFLDPAATYNTTLTRSGRHECRLALLLAPPAERSSRRHTRSPGEAGGGRSDLCHDNDEPDPVNRRARVGDNAVDSTTELRCGGGCLLELVVSWIPPGDQQGAAVRQEWKAQLGNDGKGAECPCRRHVERLAGWSVAIVLQARMDDLEVGKTQLARGCLDPVQSPLLRVDERERRRPVGEGQRKAGQPGARA